jgi:hypothetical protein
VYLGTIPPPAHTIVSLLLSLYLLYRLKHAVHEKEKENTKFWPAYLYFETEGISLRTRVQQEGFDSVKRLFYFHPLTAAPPKVAI